MHLLCIQHIHLSLAAKSVVKNVKSRNRVVKKRFFFAENSVSYLFVFPGVVTMFYIKFIFDVLQFKLRSINYGALSSYIMEKKDSIIESIEDIGIEYEEDLYVQLKVLKLESRISEIGFYQKFLLLCVHAKFYKFLAKIQNVRLYYCLVLA